MAQSSPASPYRKLTRLHRGLGNMTQVWLGPDHLLHVASTGYTETYRRFYFRDIQAMLIVHTARRTINACVLAVLLLLTLGIVNAADGGVVGLSIATGIFLPFLVWNHVLGPGCRVVMVSAVQQEAIPSFDRLNRTRRKLAEVKALIEAAQADLVTSAAAPSGGATAATSVEVVAPTLLAPPPSLPPPLPPT